MRDDQIVQRITELVDHERDLRRQLQSGRPIDADSRARLDILEVQLDQCWDLLRQRRARREFADNPEEAELRDPDTVEHYQQ